MLLWNGKIRFYLIFLLQILCLSVVIFGITAAMLSTSGQGAFKFDAKIPDRSYTPEYRIPTFPSRHGPLVYLDEGHNNFHTLKGRYQPFAKLLRQDGYRVKSFRQPFDVFALNQCGVLVIANALAKANKSRWSNPVESAFSDLELAELEAWVRQGGSLFLIADHMPFPAAASKLAKIFEVEMNNGFAYNTNGFNPVRRPIFFRRSNGTLADHAITQGSNPKEQIDYVVSYTGQAFNANGTSKALMTFGSSAISLMPTKAWRFTPNTHFQSVAGWFQGVVKNYGQGRVAIFGEAAMFTAQLKGKKLKPIGINSKQAPHNAQFTLNVMHWLSGLL